MRGIPLVVLVPVLSAQIGSFVAGAPHPGLQSTSVMMFSDVCVVEETGDVVGMELIIRVSGEEVCGVIRLFEGAPTPTETPLSGTVIGDRVSLTGEHNELKVTVDGTTAGDSIAGAVSFMVGQSHHDVTVLVPRIDITDEAQKALDHHCLLLESRGVVGTTCDQPRALLHRDREAKYVCSRKPIGPREWTGFLVFAPKRNV